MVPNYSFLKYLIEKSGMYRGLSNLWIITLPAFETLKHIHQSIVNLCICSYIAIPFSK